ncbi:hypothetical protein B0H66DRAFT_571251 [Apodospora peruviana]|uniref:Actin-like ATPase domain-containing protein n=1 Tax=Apodospora peruviana TaxID=516989 RepID=A0AAE0HTX7_9PEZI|nr:hypothetical protein B0H66DRAFT_571251 [Apodospora peruviana]
MVKTKAARNGPPKPVTIGIDIGSVSSRAFIYGAPDGLEIPVNNKSYQILKSSGRYLTGDFSSSGYPFDDRGPVYLGEDTSPDRQVVSLKYGPYVLVNTSDSLLQEYLLVGPLMERRHDVKFRDRLRRGLEDLFRVIEARVKEICKRERLQIVEIALTIPAQWTLVFEDLYRNIVADVFKCPSSNIFFCTETEALANFLLTDHLEDLGEDGCHHEVILLLDFGGHSANGCMFEVIQGEDGESSFFQIGKSFGVGGGSEQWEYAIGERCTQLFMDGHPAAMTFQRRQNCLDQFNRKKANLGPGFEASVRFSIDDEGVPWFLTVKKEDIDKCWEQAYCGPLKVASDSIAQVAKLDAVYHCCPLVVVAGGSGRHGTLRQRLTEMCKRANLREPFFIDDLNSTYGTSNIARGAAYAIGNRLTTARFFERGAAIGIQMRQGIRNPNALWDNTAKFLTSTDRQKPQTFNATGRDEFQLVCDPVFSTRVNKEDENRLYYTKCYNLLYLGKLAGGKWCFVLTLEGEGDNMWLVVNRSRKPFKRKSRWTDVRTDRLPLYFDAGANCVHVGVRGRSLKELDLQLPELAGEEYEEYYEQIAAADEGEGGEDDSQQHVERQLQQGTEEKRETMTTVWVGGRTTVSESEELQRAKLAPLTPTTESKAEFQAMAALARRAKPAGSLRNLERVDPLEPRRRKTPPMMSAFQNRDHLGTRPKDED